MSQAKDIIDGIKHRLPSRVSIYPALNRAIRMVAKRLKYHGSSKVKGKLSVSVSAGGSSGTLPEDFWGMMGDPYISWKTYTMKPLPDLQTRLRLTTDSEPEFYELYDTTMDLIPGTSSAITICGDYWKRPTAITKPSDTMPYNELFDDVIQEALIHTYVTGNSTGNGNEVALMQNFINTAVDEIIPGLDRKAPTRIPTAINFDSMMWGE